uniref:O-methyltransferase domain-containing protein n=1 Tax=Ditylum brightwellii TaxID=49249 RepID=A0A7S1ZKT8_9STRA|mmetsp:Transcript_3373/g.5159  ORF Transcript_3373/g.5159 Transcript_3373/m.5159 type:complete len:344 (+) Transcript_3373:116-1147(+)
MSLTNTKNVETAIAPPAIKGFLPQLILSKALNIVSELGIADLLADKKLTVTELAQASDTDAKSLFRLLRLLASHEIFEVHPDEKISNTANSQFLRSDVPGSQRNFIRMMGSNWMWHILNQMDNSIKTGKSAFNKAFPDALNLFQYFKEVNPAGGKIFSQSMSSMSASLDATVATSYDYSVFRSLLDIGGAEGNLLKEIKSINPEINATLFELPHVIEQVKQAPSAKVLSFEAGNFFEEIKTQADAILIKYVLHNWNDQDSLQILQNCRKALPAGGKLLIAEMLIDNNKPQVFEKSMDMVMLTLLNSAERTEAEFRSLLASAGFELTRVIPTKSPLFIIEAIPV